MRTLARKDYAIGVLAVWLTALSIVVAFAAINWPHARFRMDSVTINLPLVPDVRPSAAAIEVNAPTSMGSMPTQRTLQFLERSSTCSPCVQTIPR